MKNFGFSREVSAAKNGTTLLDTVKREIGDVNPQEVLHNVRCFIDEIEYSCKGSVDNAHPNLKYLSDACSNVSAMLGCLPILLKGDKAGSILSHPELITHLPNIDVKNFGPHFATIVEAGKAYLGASDDDVTRQDVAKQFFSLMASLISPGGEKGIIERNGKMFARKVNDLLHMHINLDGSPKEPEITNPN